MVRCSDSSAGAATALRCGRFATALEAVARGVCSGGGFATEQDAAAALERELDRLRREQRVPRSLTLSELVEPYLAQHDVQPVTIAKLRYLLGKATVVFGHRRI
jgi:hypothetical protein